MTKPSKNRIADPSKFSSAIRDLNPDLFRENKPLDARLPHPKPQPALRQALERPRRREDEGRERIVISITGYRCRCLDPDNFAASCKPAIDQLRYSGLIPEDDPQTIRLITDQVRVRTRKEEGTEIEIDFPTSHLPTA